MYYKGHENEKVGDGVPGCRPCEQGCKKEKDHVRLNIYNEGILCAYASTNTGNSEKAVEIRHMKVKYAEEIFEPKRILSCLDWLGSMKESDQFYESYKQGKGNIKWVDQNRNKIHLFACDDSFTNAQMAAF